MNKKICVISGIFPPDVGGPATFLDQALLALAKREYLINVITYGDGGPVPDYPFLVKRIQRKKSALIKLLLFVFYIFKHGRKADLLFVSDYGIPAMIANFFLRKKMVIRIVEDFAWEYSVRHEWTSDLIDEFQIKRYSFRVELLKKIRSMYIKRADKVIVPSCYLKKMVANWGVDAEKIQVVYNAINTQNLDLACTKEEARNRLNLRGQIILSVARLTPWKGIDTIINALPRIGQDIRLIVIGEGEYLSYLQDLIARKTLSDRVEFLGSVEHSLVFLYMKAADVFVLDSGYEGLSHVLLEAMLAKVPIIASDKGGNPELIVDKENGLLVPYGEDKALAGAIKIILENPDLAKKFINSSKEKVKHFEWDRLIKEVLLIIEKYS